MKEKNDKERKKERKKERERESDTVEKKKSQRLHRRCTQPFLSKVRSSSKYTVFKITTLYNGTAFLIKSNL